MSSDSLYKRLQPAPSPQQFSYLNQFDGQELTITKQLNTAFVSPGDPLSRPLPTGSPRTSPAHEAPTSCPPSASTPAGQSPAVDARPQSVGTAPALAPPPGVDPSKTLVSPYATPPAGSALTSNITSESLANLAKGVSDLSDQMQAKMLQGGPFHTIQVQGNMADVNQVPGTNSGTPQSEDKANPDVSVKQEKKTSPRGQPPASNGGPPPPPQQPPIQGQFHPGAPGPLQGQVNPMSMSGGGQMMMPPGEMMNGGGPPPQFRMPVDPRSLHPAQQQMYPAQGPPQGFDPMDPRGFPYCPPGEQFPGQFGGPQQPPQTGRPNSGVHVQSKTPNTIQYMPAPGSIPPPQPTSKRKPGAMHPPPPQQQQQQQQSDLYDPTGRLMVRMPQYAGGNPQMMMQQHQHQQHQQHQQQQQQQQMMMMQQQNFPGSAPRMLMPPHQS